MLKIERYLNESKVVGSFIQRGYTVKTLLQLIKENFGYKNGQDIRKELNIPPSHLNKKYVYLSEEEYHELINNLSICIKDIESRKQDILNDPDSSKDYMKKNIEFYIEILWRGFRFRDLYKFSIENKVTEAFNNLIDKDEYFNYIP